MQSGVNYFFNLLSLDPDIFKVYYEFDGTGNANVASISGGDPAYSYTGNLFQENSSGYFSNQALKIPNESGLWSDEWTMFFVYERAAKQNSVLFSCYHGNAIKSGFAIGINDANRLYFETYSASGPAVLEADQLNLATKNAVAISKIGDNVYFNLFDFNSKSVLSQGLSVDSSYLLNSNGWYLGGAVNAPGYFVGSNFSGYLDSFLYFNSPLMPYQLNRMFSGFYANDSGIQSVDYVHSFGMDGVSFLEQVDSNDRVEIFSFSKSHNKTAVNQEGIFNRTYQEFVLPQSYDQNSLNVYINGASQVGSGLLISGNYYSPVYLLSGAYYASGQELFSNRTYDAGDELIFDVVSGIKQFARIPQDLIGGNTVAMSGQNNHVFLNGVKLLSGVDYTLGGSNIVLTSGLTQVSGSLCSFPIDTGYYDYVTGQRYGILSKKFARNTSQVWLNGVRQSLPNQEYVETSSVSPLTGIPSYSAATSIVLNDDSFWSPISLGTEIINAVDRRLVGKDPNIAKPIFSIQDHANAIYQRNPNCWIADLDLTSISPWNSAGGNLLAGTLITPRHIIFAAHFQIPPGALIRFIDKNNNIVTRTVTHTMTDPAYQPYFPDITVGVLDSDVSSNISFAKVLPQDWATKISSSYLGSYSSGLPGMGTDQEEKALVVEFTSIVGSVQGIYPSTPPRVSFFEFVIPGDSGDPAFWIIDDQLVLLTTWTYGGAGGGTSFMTYTNDINTLIKNLDVQNGSDSGYTLTPIDLSAYGN